MKKQRKKIHTKTKNSAQRFVIITTLITVFLVGAFMAIHLIDEKETEVALASVSNPITSTDLQDIPMLGKKEAPITLVEFGDFTCPSCKFFDQNILPQVKQNYIDTGKVKLFYVDVLLHGEKSKKAALAAQFVFHLQPEAYWSFHSALFQAQPKTEDEWVTPELLSRLAQQTTTIDPKEVNKDTYLKNIMTEQQLVNRLQISSTPTLFINGIPVNALDYGDISRELEQTINNK